MIIENVLLNSKSLEDFTSQLNNIISSCEDSIEMFCASLNAKKILREIKKSTLKNNKTIQFVIYNNDEVSLYTGTKKDIVFFKEKLNWKFKELNNGSI
tara:strand:+ start:3047 stop:3340 length:294 start_codon:yes stop_codon:yes gene_type:complete